MHKPILVVWGDRDRILPPKHFEVAKYTFPLAKSHLFPGTGHMPQIERPEEFAALVREFHASLCTTQTTTRRVTPQWLLTLRCCYMPSWRSS